MLEPVLSREKPYKGRGECLDLPHHLSACPKLLVSQSQDSRMESVFYGPGEDMGR